MFLFCHNGVERLRENGRPNFVIIVTDAFDGRIVANKNYKNIVSLPNIENLQGYRFNIEFKH